MADVDQETDDDVETKDGSRKRPRYQDGKIEAQEDRIRYLEKSIDHEREVSKKLLDLLSAFLSKEKQ